MKRRPTSHRAPYDQDKDVPEDVLQNGMQFGCPNASTCGCQSCLSGAHTDGRTLVHCNEHNNGCHLQCS